MVYATPPLPPVASHSTVSRLQDDEAATLLSKVEDYVSRMLKAALPGNYLVDFFPWMKHIPSWAPGAAWKREGYEWYRKDTNMFLGLMQQTETELVCSLDNQSLLRYSRMVCRNPAAAKNVFLPNSSNAPLSMG